MGKTYRPLQTTGVVLFLPQNKGVEENLNTLVESYEATDVSVGNDERTDGLDDVTDIVVGDVGTGRQAKAYLEE